ncbi:MAG: erythromycin esterase family protein [Halobacteriaceae archaeon]
MVEYLEDVDPEAADVAREAARCFEPYGEDAQEYARATRLVPEGCETEVIELLDSLREGAPDYEGETETDRFAAEQNALVARNAEHYYRAMVGGDEDSWNVRDRHMYETLTRLLDHHGPDASGVVWAHNTHVGDARATDMPGHGRLNIGQLAREGEATPDVELVGFGSHRGSVIAGEAWDAPMAEMEVPRGRSGSYEDVFHRVAGSGSAGGGAGGTSGGVGGRRAGAGTAGADRLLLSDDLPADSALHDPRGHRAIGVVYSPQLESGNYVPTVLPERYDAFLHVDETRALHPLEVHPDREQVPDRYPSGL